MQQLTEGRTAPGPFTLTLDPSTMEVEVVGRLEADPFDTLDGYSHTARTVRISKVTVRVSFKAGREPYLRFIGYGFQVRKDGSLGRNVNGVTIYPTEVQRESALDLARRLIQRDIGKAIGVEPTEQ